MEERLQKIIAQAGVSSRRAAESLITGGHVRVNGRVVTELGTKADARNDKIEVDGRRLVAELPVYYVVHKPRGVVSTMSDPEGRPTVATLVKTLKVRVFPVGRLDFATSGVLLMTNDGELSAALLHPRKSVPKTYVLKVQGAAATPGGPRRKAHAQHPPARTHAHPAREAHGTEEPKKAPPTRPARPPQAPQTTRGPRASPVERKLRNDASSSSDPRLELAGARIAEGGQGRLDLAERLELTEELHVAEAGRRP
jgi:23S rRNA-/tRNA-specific pseudouridylate synthase